MRPAARLRAAADILDAVLAGLDRPGPTAEARLAEWGRANRYAGSKDRAAIGDLAFDALRRRRRLALAMAGADGGPGASAGASEARALLLAAQAAQGASLAEIQALAAGGDRALAPLSPGEAARLEIIASSGLDAASPPDASPAARADFPDWLWPALTRSTVQPEQEAAYLTRRAAVDLRVNTLKASPDAAAEALAAAGVAVGPAPWSPIGLRCAGAPRLGGLAPRRDGWVEPQDAASQAAALLCGARPGETVLDFCAGGGGKTLALAAQMAGRGRLLAYDVAPKRMIGLADRAAAAGARVEILRAAQALAPLESACDLVVVDAPCSGSGSWARDPEGKWRLTPDRLAALGRAQQAALDRAAEQVRPGGRLVYITCSLLACENEDQTRAFAARRPEFAPADVARAWTEAGLRGDPPGGGPAGTARLSPAARGQDEGADGFFIAIFQRRGGADGLGTNRAA